ncbi:hypothetical protein NL108_004920 [Boleophthalmus pectinirostris]|nr:hypothetical protein NL108_004920 [Boleophthalmus pectinirostris]
MGFGPIKYTLKTVYAQNEEYCGQIETYCGLILRKRRFGNCVKQFSANVYPNLFLKVHCVAFLFAFFRSVYLTVQLRMFQSEALNSSVSMEASVEVRISSVERRAVHTRMYRPISGQ